MARNTAALFTGDYDAAAGLLVPNLIIPEIMASSGREEVFMPHVRRFDCTGPGEVFSIPQADVLDFAATSATYITGILLDETLWSPTTRTLTPRFYYVDVGVGMDVMQGVQSGISVVDQIVKEAGIGLAKSHDAIIAANYGEPAATSGTDATELNFTALRTAYGILIAANAPRPYTWVIHPTQVLELLKDDTFINAGVKGAPVLTSGIQAGGYLTSILDIGIYVSDQIVESSGLHSMMFSKNAAYAYGFKRLTNPATGTSSELMLDVDWVSGARRYDINMTYQGCSNGAVFTSSTNAWAVDYIS